jgi:hypothetical protein
MAHQTIINQIKSTLKRKKHTFGLPVKDWTIEVAVCRLLSRVGWIVAVHDDPVHVPVPISIYGVVLKSMTVAGSIRPFNSALRPMTFVQHGKVQ